MTSSDLIVSAGNGWVGVLPTGATAILYNANSSHIIYRFGISSTSKGIVLAPGCSIKIDDVVYIKEATAKKRVVISYT